jgi:hypothetical protein
MKLEAGDRIFPPTSGGVIVAMTPRQLRIHGLHRAVRGQWLDPGRRHIVG